MMHSKIIIYIHSFRYQWLIFINMLLKWSQEQDQQLHRVIRRHGTSNWALVRKHFKGNRSRDSVIKRWHGKLKFQKYVPICPPEKTKKIANDRRRQAQNRKNPPNKKTNTNITKKQENIPPPKPIQNLNIRSQRLRNIIEKSEPNKIKSIQVQPQQKMESQQIEKIHQKEPSQNGQAFQWSKIQDEKLLSIVVQQGITNWSRIGSMMGCSEKEVRNRWRKAIYNMIKLDDKVGGFLKYSTEEDSILTNSFRNGLNWSQIMQFLPGRSEFSIEARWRRLLRPQLQIQLSKNKHYIIRQFLKRIIEKKQGEHAMVEQLPVSEPQTKNV